MEINMGVKKKPNTLAQLLIYYMNPENRMSVARLEITGEDSYGKKIFSLGPIKKMSYQEAVNSYFERKEIQKVKKLLLDLKRDSFVYC